MSARPVLPLRVLVAATLVTAMLAAATQASAAPGSLREGLFGEGRYDGRRFSAPPVGRYVVEDGRAFVLDRSTPRPLMKFENSAEVWVLQAQPAPRGDIIYKNDLGEPVLRATRLGGLTVFTQERPSGAPAALVGDSNPLRLPVLGPEALLQKLAQASARASRAARRLIPFEADASPQTAPLVADAAMVAAEAVVRMSANAEGRAALTKVSKVTLVEGKRPGASLRAGVILITITPEDGLAGRPSSQKIVAAAGVR
ncbi:DUF4908 domain-containing protein [Phenylobacterium sp.]|uniref:DUF4908 domain-containing protein n=1 Tax=Phenylobacterium sp. TaxID=1871053 RepID=UPI0008BCC2EC|nr:DUF4908 domain-containing protein [Phenylobacterium sp.]MBA4794309.1 DUF4908 domain-containing protein [Phenylobacterium sp.]MBC7166796.1 DUF4908 domain-containing protein [Phenylobacterium sp.]OHB32961.1 MAG: DUF4908 domain-containing protein [Phenylobacterium sp. RIFCSPHIGHO2_01_FULL_70_10]